MRASVQSKWLEEMDKLALALFWSTQWKSETLLLTEIHNVPMILLLVDCVCNSIWILNQKMFSSHIRKKSEEIVFVTFGIDHDVFSFNPKVVKA